MRKFAYKEQRTIKQTVQRLRPLYPLWILEGAGQYMVEKICNNSIRLESEQESEQESEYSWHREFDETMMNHLSGKINSTSRGGCNQLLYSLPILSSAPIYKDNKNVIFFKSFNSNSPGSTL